MRRSKVTLLFSLTCSVDFCMLSPYRPYNKPAFLALIPPSFTSLNPFVTFVRPLPPHSSSHNWGKYENSRFNSEAFGYTAISRKVVGKNVHATIPKGNMGYNQFTVPPVPDTVAVQPTFVTFL